MHPDFVLVHEAVGAIQHLLDIGVGLGIILRHTQRHRALVPRMLAVVAGGKVESLSRLTQQLIAQLVIVSGQEDDEFIAAMTFWILSVASVFSGMMMYR